MGEGTRAFENVAPRSSGRTWRRRRRQSARSRAGGISISCSDLMELGTTGAMERKGGDPSSGDRPSRSSVRGRQIEVSSTVPVTVTQTGTFSRGQTALQDRTSSASRGRRSPQDDGNVPEYQRRGRGGPAHLPLRGGVILIAFTEKLFS